MLRIIFAAGALAMGIGLLAARTPIARAADEHVVIVTMTDDDTFSPASVTVPAGTVVRWVNKGSTDTHNVTDDPQAASDAKDVAMPTGAKVFRSGAIKPGASFEQTFTVAGTYKYVCVPHESMGMKGQIVVK